MKHWPWQHKYHQTKIVGEYHSITGPRIIVNGTCECGKTTTWTKLGEMRYYD